MTFSWNPGLIRSRIGPCPGPRGTKQSSGRPGNRDTLRPDTRSRQGRDPLPPLPHLSWLRSRPNRSSAVMTGQMGDGDNRAATWPGRQRIKAAARCRESLNSWTVTSVRRDPSSGLGEFLMLRDLRDERVLATAGAGVAWLARTWAGAGGLAEGMLGCRARRCWPRGAVRAPVTRIFSLYVVQAGSAFPA